MRDKHFFCSSLKLIASSINDHIDFCSRPANQARIENVVHSPLFKHKQYALSG